MNSYDRLKVRVIGEPVLQSGTNGAHGQQQPAPGGSVQAGKGNWSRLDLESQRKSAVQVTLPQSKSKENASNLVFIDYYNEVQPVKRVRNLPIKNALPLPLRGSRGAADPTRANCFSDKTDAHPKNRPITNPSSLGEIGSSSASSEGGFVQAKAEAALSRDNQTYVMHHDLLDKLHENHRHHSTITAAAEAAAALVGRTKAVESGGSLSGLSIFSQSSSNDSSLSSAENFCNKRAKKPRKVSAAPNAQMYTEKDLTAVTEQLKSDLSVCGTNRTPAVSPPSRSTPPPPPPYNGAHLKRMVPLCSNAMDSLPLTTRSLTEGLPTSPEVDEPHILGVCHQCKEKVRQEDEPCVAMSTLYHSRCFTCYSCGRGLKHRHFYSVNGKNFCKEDFMYSEFQHTVKKCFECGHLIMDMILQAMGKSYHPGCFRCTVCNDSLDGVTFTVGVDNKVYCVKDFHKRFAPKCYACNELITPQQGPGGTVRLVAMDKDFHVDCYRCQDCHKNLSEEPDKRCFPIGDTLLCYSCHMARLANLTSSVSPATISTPPPKGCYATDL